MSVSEEDFNKLDASKHSVKVPTKFGGGRMASVEFVHQVHCVVSPLYPLQFVRVSAIFQVCKLTKCSTSSGRLLTQIISRTTIKDLLRTLACGAHTWVSDVQTVRHRVS